MFLGVCVLCPVGLCCFIIACLSGACFVFLCIFNEGFVGMLMCCCADLRIVYLLVRATEDRSGQVM